MATNPQPTQPLPLFYNEIQPISSNVHLAAGLKPRTDLKFTAHTHAVPLTVDEFAAAQRSHPIVFGVGEGAAPLALLGLQEGVNMNVDDAGEWRAGAYVPAYIRRYPFMLAKLRPEATELSLCFDQTAELIADDADDKLFKDGGPSDTTKNILTFCEQFEQAIARTRSFMTEIDKLGLLMDGEVTIQNPGMAQPAVYRGFRMVNEEKLRELRGDQARKMIQNGMLGLIYAHLFSLTEIRALFDRQQAAAQATPPNVTLN